MVLSTPSANFKTNKPLYKPVKSSKQGKKGMVYVKNASGGKKLIHFGDSKMSDFTKHKDSGRRANYLARSGGIRDKSGKLTARNKNSANYWARTVLWGAK
tara:strand:+ start:200 stop:499 length:300 start_codon:yes stop_codon:yes gene_type:complete